MKVTVWVILGCLSLLSCNQTSFKDAFDACQTDKVIPSRLVEVPTTQKVFFDIFNADPNFALSEYVNRGFAERLDRQTHRRLLNEFEALTLRELKLVGKSLSGSAVTQNELHRRFFEIKRFLYPYSNAGFELELKRLVDELLEISELLTNDSSKDLDCLKNAEHNSGKIPSCSWYTFTQLRALADLEHTLLVLGNWDLAQKIEKIRIKKFSRHSLKSDLMESYEMCYSDQKVEETCLHSFNVEYALKSKLPDKAERIAFQFWEQENARPIDSEEFRWSTLLSAVVQLAKFRDVSDEIEEFFLKVEQLQSSENLQLIFHPPTALNILSSCSDYYGGGKRQCYNLLGSYLTFSDVCLYPQDDIGHQRHSKCAVFLDYAWAPMFLNSGLPSGVINSIYDYEQMDTHKSIYNDGLIDTYQSIIDLSQNSKIIKTISDSCESESQLVERAAELSLIPEYPVQSYKKRAFLRLKQLQLAKAVEIDKDHPKARKIAVELYHILKTRESIIFGNTPDVGIPFSSEPQLTEYALLLMSLASIESKADAEKLSKSNLE